MHTRIEERHLDPELLPSYVPDPSTKARLVEPVLAAVQAAVAEGSVTAAQVFAGRVHARKSEECATAFGSPASTARGRGGDDFYLQIGVRVPAWASAPVLEAIRDVEALSTEQALREKQKLLVEARARTEAAQEAEARIQAEIDRLSSAP